MSQPDQPPRPTQRSHKQLVRHYQNRILLRKLQIQNYLWLYAFIAVVYGGAIVLEWGLAALVDMRLNGDLDKSPQFAVVYGVCKEGLAIVFAFGALVHGLLSTWYLMKLDQMLLRESEDNE